MKTDFRMMLLILLSLVICVSCVKSEDSLIIIHAPNSVKFNSIDSFKSSDVGDIFSAMFAYTVSKDLGFQSLAPVNPLNRPKAIWVFDIHKDTDNIDLNLKGQKFPMENYGKLWKQYDLLKERTSQQYSMYQKDSPKPVFVKFDAGEELYAEASEQDLLKNVPQLRSERLKLALKDPELSQLIKEKTFNISNDADAELLIEIETIKLSLKALRDGRLKLSDSVPDVFWVEVRSLISIVRRYGADSYQAKEAARLIQQVVSDTFATMNSVYDGNAVVAVFVESPIPELKRNARSLLTEAPATAEASAEVVLNLAYAFDSEFHVAFALVTFTTVLLILSVLGISVGMWFLDPGRDSIIYRMTSQRMKKD